MAKHSIYGKLLMVETTTGALIQSGLGEFTNGVINGATVTGTELGGPILRKTVLTLTATPVALTDDAGAGQYGGVLVYTFPQGLINIQGAIVTGALTGYASLIDTFGGFVALGTVTATTGATLVSTEADIMQAVALTTAVAEVAAVDAVSVAAALTESGARWHDGSTTAVPMFLNFVVTDNVAHGSGTAYFTGTVQVQWSTIGDN